MRTKRLLIVVGLAAFAVLVIAAGELATVGKSDPPSLLANEPTQQD